MGFPVPLNSWFGGNFNQHAREIILGNQSSLQGVINLNEVEKMLNDPNLITDHSMALKIWMLMNLAIFVKQSNFIT